MFFIGYVSGALTVLIICGLYFRLTRDQSELVVSQPELVRVRSQFDRVAERYK